MNPTLPPKCERWPAPPARDYALFAEPPGATGAGALELVVTRRVIDPRELCLTPAVTERFHAVGNGLCDWVWLSAGLDEPAGSIWLDIDAAYDEAAMIETLHALIPPTP